MAQQTFPQDQDLYPYWICNCRHEGTRVYYANAVQPKLGYELLLHLSRLGVRRIDLTPEAANQLTASVKGLYDPTVPVGIGEAAGVAIYRVAP